MNRLNPQNRLRLRNIAQRIVDLIEREHLTEAEDCVVLSLALCARIKSEQLPRQVMAEVFAEVLERAYPGVSNG